MLRIPTPTIENTAPDGLSRQVWTFWVTDRLEIVLDTYREETRPSLRHRNWQTGRLYRRTSSGNERSNMPVEAVPFPEEVQDAARAQVIELLRVRLTPPPHSLF
jgi:hypothetical protein